MVSGNRWHTRSSRATFGKDGGLAGVRTPELLEGILISPFQTFGGEDLYPTLIDRAAKLAYEIIKQHPFNDGNKRTAAALPLVVPRRNGVYVLPGRDDLYKTVLDLADDDIEYADLIRTPRGCVRAQK